MPLQPAPIHTPVFTKDPKGDFIFSPQWMQWFLALAQTAGDPVWGTITGSLPDQLDLAAALATPTHGAVGALVVAASTGMAAGTTINVGDTVAGSTLVVTNATATGTNVDSLSASSSSTMLVITGATTSLGYTGTWVSLSKISMGATATNRPIGLFQRTV